MLSQGQLSDTTAAIYTVGAATTAQVKTLLFFNGGAGVNTVTVHLVPNNATAVGTAALDNQVLSVALPTGDTFEFSPAYPVVYSAENDTIQASATNASEVSYFVMGVES